MEEKKFEELNEAINNFDKIQAEAQANAIVEVAKKPEDLLNLKLSQTINDKVNNEIAVKEKVGKTADVVIEHGLRSQENEIKTVEGDTDLALKKEVYTHFGIDKKVDKPWKRRMYQVFVDFWEIVIGITMGLTIVPVSIILDRFTSLQNKWVRTLAVLAGFVGLLGLIALGIFGFNWVITYFKSLAK